nr:MAG TPA: hypothetical protein [Caudoviricetes sp.]
MLFRVRLVGGSSNNGTNAGAFVTNANNAATNTNANVSSPLNFASSNRNKSVKENLAAWRKITNAERVPVGW